MDVIAILAVDTLGSMYYNINVVKNDPLPRVI